MADAVNTRRRYDSSGRQAQARQNRAAILAAARRLFLDDGYGATTMPAVAAAAGVSVETIYKAFDNKPGLLKAVFDVAVAGDDEPVPLLERDVVARIVAEPDPRQKLRIFAESHVGIVARAAPLRALARDAAASDPAAAEVWEQLSAERLAGMAAFADGLARGGHLRAGVTVEEARDVLWTYSSGEQWELLVAKRGWTPERFGRWMGAALAAALL